MMTVKLFDLQTCVWSMLKTYGKPPVSRGGMSMTLVEMTRGANEQNKGE